MKIIVTRARSLRQRYRFLIVAKNGQVVAQSELYRNRGDALKTARSISAAKITVEP